jgi:hypothetical protein
MKQTGCPGQSALERYASGALNDWEAAELDLHLAECDFCARETSEMRRSAELWERLRDPLAPIFDVVGDTQGGESLRQLAELLGGQVWGAVRLVWEMPRALPRLVPLAAMAASPFQPFAETTPATRTRGSTSGHTPTRGDREIGHAVGEGRCQLRLVQGQGGRTTVLMLENWTGGAPPRAAISSDSGVKELHWEKTGPGRYRAAAGGRGDITLAFGPPEA